MPINIDTFLYILIITQTLVKLINFSSTTFSQHFSEVLTEISVPGLAGKKCFPEDIPADASSTVRFLGSWDSGSTLVRQLLCRTSGETEQL